MPAHTPAPWKFDELGLTGADGKPVHQATDLSGADIFRVMADRKLICAAPDLFAAARQILTDSDRAEETGDWEHLNNNDHWDALREAIAKAEGK